MTLLTGKQLKAMVNDIKERMMINITEEQFKEIVTQAHMAGQHNQTGCDPSCFEAETHWQKQVKNLGLFSVSNRSICSKCGKELYKGWEQATCNFTLNLNIDCQSTKALWGEDENIGFEHPAIEEGSGYQGLKIVSGEDKDYRLCISCHRKFTKMIGDWLKNGC